MTYVVEVRGFGFVTRSKGMGWREALRLAMLLVTAGLKAKVKAGDRRRYEGWKD